MLVSLSVDVAKVVEIAMLVRAEDDAEDRNMLLDVWNPDVVVSECVKTVLSLVEDANSEFDIWFVDTEAFAGFNPRALKRLLNVVFGEPVPLKPVTSLGWETDLLRLDESDVAAELLGMVSTAVVAAVALLLEDLKSLEPLWETSQVVLEP